MEGSSSDTGDEYAIFNDWEASRSHLQKENRTNHTRAPRHGHRNPFSRQRRFRPSLPGLDEVSTFYRDVFTRAKMESDCIIMSLVYVERLIKTTGGKLRPTTENWRSILFSCMVLSSKVWDDLSMWNADFRRVKDSISYFLPLPLNLLASLLLIIFFHRTAAKPARLEFDSPLNALMSWKSQSFRH